MLLFMFTDGGFVLDIFLFIDDSNGLRKDITNLIVGFCGYTVAAFVRITEILLNIFEK